MWVVQWFEKMVSGMYLGEIVRHMLLRLAEEATLFGDTVPEKLREQQSLETKHVSKIHADISSELQTVATVLHEVLRVGHLASHSQLVFLELRRIDVKKSSRANQL